MNHVIEFVKSIQTIPQAIVATAIIIAIVLVIWALVRG